MPRLRVPWAKARRARVLVTAALLLTAFAVLHNSQRKLLTHGLPYSAPLGFGSSVAEQQLGLVGTGRSSEQRRVHSADGQLTIEAELAGAGKRADRALHPVETTEPQHRTEQLPTADARAEQLHPEQPSAQAVLDNTEQQLDAAASLQPTQPQHSPAAGAADAGESGERELQPDAVAVTSPSPQLLQDSQTQLQAVILQRPADEPTITSTDQQTPQDVALAVQPDAQAEQGGALAAGLSSDPAAGQLAEPLGPKEQPAQLPQADPSAALLAAAALEPEEHPGAGDAELDAELEPEQEPAQQDDPNEVAQLQQEPLPDAAAAAANPLTLPQPALHEQQKPKPAIQTVIPTAKDPTAIGPYCPNATADMVPDLQSVHRWPPSQAPNASSVTLVTQLNMDRLDMLRNQCALWSGHIAAVVYAPSWNGRLLSLENDMLNNTALLELPAILSAFIGRAEAGGSCTLTMELVSEDVDAWLALAYYPFNALRNRALELVQTDLVLLLDTDFLPSASLSTALAQPRALTELKRMTDARFAVVLPAFETLDAQLVTALVRDGKDAAVAAYTAGQIVGFQLDRYPKGHASTSYPRWVKAKKPYLIDYDEGYEPYLIVARKYVPWYDERFRGYGQDKVVQVLNMAGWLQFVVHPTAFVIHQPHVQGKMHSLTSQSGQWDELMRLYMETRLEIFKHRYVPVSRRSCSEESQLPRWEAPANQQHMVELAGEDVVAFKAKHKNERLLRERKKRVKWQPSGGS